MSICRGRMTTPDANILAALAHHRTTITNAERAGDTRAAFDARRALAEACECFRKTYCPDATSVHVTCDRTTGRPLRVFAYVERPWRVEPIYYERTAA